MRKILSLIKEGANQGAKLLYGGERHGREGYFVKPTVFADVQEDHVIAKEEVSCYLISSKYLTLSVEFSSYSITVHRTFCFLVLFI